MFSIFVKDMGVEVISEINKSTFIVLHTDKNKTVGRFLLHDTHKLHDLEQPLENSFKSGNNRARLISLNI
jgi:hypothetical protein